MKEYVIRPKTRDINMFVINNSGEELLGTGRQNTRHLLSRIKICRPLHEVRERKILNK